MHNRGGGPAECSAPSPDGNSWDAVGEAMRVEINLQLGASIYPLPLVDSGMNHHVGVDESMSLFIQATLGKDCGGGGEREF